ncbi:MAG: kelch repeat-containing protein [Gemmatimonas sp.]
MRTKPGRIGRMMVVTSLVAACGGGTEDVVPPEPVIAVAVVAPPAAIAAGGTHQFVALVTGATNTSVTWSVDAVGSTNVGTISATGLYTAPNTAGTFTVRATTMATPTRTATASITVNAPPVTVSVTPATISLGAGGVLQLSASVTGATNQAVTWDLPGGASTGAVLSTGTANATYTAPATPGTYQVRATSIADATRNAVATVTVGAGTGFRINGPARVAPNASTQFTATLNDVATTATWAIDGAAHGSSVSATGVFTAGPTQAILTLRATDASGRTATFTVNVATQVMLDLIVPANPILTNADMLTFYWQIGPTGISSDVTWTVDLTARGTTVPVDYFRGFIPSSTTGTVTLTAASVVDPAVTKSFAATVTAAQGSPFAATSGAPTTARYEHAAATMPDGRVVMVGGQRSRGTYVPLATTDVFNPVSGTFTAGPTIGTSRIKAEAIAIDANRVLVTGGAEDYNLAYNSALIVDLAGGTSTAAANTMSARRLFHQTEPITTGVHAGKIAVIGGFNGPIPYGVPTWQSTTSVDLFDGATNRFTAYTASLRTPRGLFTATPLQDGKILIVGGYDAAASNALASAEIFDPVAGTITFTGSMSKARWGHTATRLANGMVLVVGGSNNGADGASAELYNPSTGQFEAVNGAMSVSRTNHAASILGDGRVVIAGGETGENYVRGTVEVYDPTTRTFSALGFMSTARRRPTATSLTSGPNAGRILIFGGSAEERVGLAAEILR